MARRTLERDLSFSPVPAAHLRKPYPVRIRSQFETNPQRLTTLLHQAAQNGKAMQSNVESGPLKLPFEPSPLNPGSMATIIPIPNFDR